MADQYRCIVCLEHWQYGKMLIMACGTVLCKDCKDQIVVCPICRVPMDKNVHILTGSASQILKDHIHNLEVHCESSLCAVLLKVSQIKQHEEKECVGRTSICDECKCPIVLANQRKHDADECMSRIINCVECGMLMHASSFAKHILDMCEEVEVPCPISERCRKKVLRKDMAKHMDTQCEFIEINCPYRECGQKTTKFDLERHMESCKFRPIDCEQCKMPVKHRKDLHAHMKVCKEKYLNCVECKKSLKRKFLFSHITAHCPKRWSLCKGKGCTFAYCYDKESSDSKTNTRKKHHCPQLDFDLEFSVKLGMFLDVRNEFNCWFTVVALSNELKDSSEHKFSALQLVGNDNIAISPIVCARRSNADIAPPFSMSRAGIVFIGATISIPLDSFCHRPWTIGQFMTKEETPICVGNVNHDLSLQYVTMSVCTENPVVSYHHIDFSPNVANVADEKTIAVMVPCVVKQIFDDYMRVSYGNKDFCTSRRKSEFWTLQKTSDLVEGDLYSFSIASQDGRNLFYEARLLHIQVNVDIMVTMLQFKLIESAKDLLKSGDEDDKQKIYVNIEDNATMQTLRPFNY